MSHQKFLTTWYQRIKPWRFLIVLGIIFGLLAYRQPIQAQLSQWATPTPMASLGALLSTSSETKSNHSGGMNPPAATCQSTGTGNWNTAGTWTACGGTTPQAADTVTILNTHTVTMDTNPSITSITIDSGGTLTVSGSNTLTISANYTNNGTFTASTGLVTMTSTSGSKTLSGTMTGSSAFYDLTFNGSGGGWSFSNDVTTGRDLTVTLGTLNVNGKTVIVTRDMTLASSASAILTMGAAAMTVGNNWTKGASGTFNRDTSTVTIDGSSDGSSSVNATQFYNAVFGKSSGSPTVTLTSSPVYVWNNLTFQGGTVTASTTMEIAVLRDSAGTYTPVTINNSPTLSGTTVSFYYQTKAASITMNITGGNYGTWTVLGFAETGNSSIFNLAGNFTSTNMLNMYGTTGVTGTTFNTQNYSITAARFITANGSNSAGITANFGSSTVVLSNGTSDAFRPSTSGAHTINLQTSNITVTGNILFTNTGTWTVDAGTSTITMTPAAATAVSYVPNGQSLYNFVINGGDTGADVNPTTAAIITNDLTMTAGRLIGTSNITVNGNVTGTAGIINRTGGTFTQRASSSKNFGTTSGSTAWTFSSLTFSNSHASAGLTYTTQTGGTGGITVSGTLLVGASGDAAGATTTLDAGNRTWTLSSTAGDPFQILASPAGVLTGNTSTFSYTGANGSGNTTVQSSTGYYAITLNASDTFVLEGTTTLANNLTITTGTLDVVSGQDYPLTIGGNYSNSGTFNARTGTVTFSATDTGNTLSGTLSGSSYFYNLIFNGSGGEWTPGAAMDVINNLTMTAGSLLGTNNVTVTGHVAGTAGIINLTGGTFEQRVEADKNFGTTSGSAAWTFSSLTFSEANTEDCFPGGTTITTQTGGSGSITVSSILRVGKSGDICQTVLNAGNRTWTLSGTAGDPFQLLASPAGTLTAATSVFNYTGANGSGNTTVQVATYYALTINASDTFVLEGNTIVSNNLTITTGTLDVVDGQNYSLTVGGNFANSGTFTARSGTVTLNGSAQQTVSDGASTNTFYALTITNASGTADPGCGTSFTPGVIFSNAVTTTNTFTITTASTKVRYNSTSSYTFNNINWNGQAAGTKIQFRNSNLSSGTWLLNVTGTQTAVSYVDVARSDASGGNAIAGQNGTNTNCSNNTNWVFANPDSPASLAQTKTDSTALSTGSWTNETTVRFTASISGSNPSTIQLCVEKDLLGTGFSNTEDSCGTAVSYTGTAVTASVTISSLTDGANYHWQARVKDASSNYSSWAAYGSNVETSSDFGIDVTGPTTPTNVSSASHTVSVWSAGSIITMIWTAPTDASSGIGGYSYLFDTTATTIPDATQDIGPTTAVQSSTLTDGTTHYFHLRAVDAVGNWGSAVHLGPFTLDLTVPIGPTDLASSDHAVSVSSTDPTITITWTRAIDPGPGSGLAGYSYSFTATSDTTPDTLQDVGLVTTVTSNSLAEGSWYAHLRPVDAVGNWGNTAHLGPFVIGTNITPTPTVTSTPPPAGGAIATPTAPSASESTKTGTGSQSSVTPSPAAAPTPKVDAPPLVFTSGWNLLPVQAIRAFVFAPLPGSFGQLAKQIPQLQKTLTSLSIGTLATLSRLSGGSLSLPTLATLAGLPSPGPLGRLTAQVKQDLPTDVVFAQTGNELVDLTIKLTTDDTGNARQYISTITGSPLQLATRPNQPVESISGQVIFTGLKASLVPKRRVVTAAGWLAPPALADEARVETRLVSETFDYSDPDHDGLYTAHITAPLTDGEYEIITTYHYQDNQAVPREVRLITVVDPEGYIYEKFGDQEARVRDAVVTLKVLDQKTGAAEDWPAKQYLQKNPQITDQTGRYSFLVPAGRYRLEVTANGYRDTQSDELVVEEGRGVHLNIELTSSNPLKQIGWPELLVALTLVLGYSIGINIKRRQRG